MSIALASFLAMNIAGNNLHSKYEGSTVTETVASFDQILFGEDNVESENGQSAKRTGASVGMVILAVLGIIALLITLCAGICIALLTATSIFHSIWFLLIWILGVLIAVFSVLGIISLIKWLANPIPDSKS